MLRIGLTQRTDEVAGYEETRDALDQRWTGLLLSLGYLPVPLPNAGVPAAVLVDQLSLGGLILTGGGDPGQGTLRDALESGLIKLCLERHLPLIGVCRGAQALGLHFGGRLTRVEGHVASRHGLICCRPESWAERASVNSYHNYAFMPDNLPPPLRPVALAPGGTVEAFEHERLPMLGIMWHPEREPGWDEGDVATLRRLFD